MLTDMLEEEFDIKDEEPWYDHQDLEHDLRLAAELGKDLLERNRELEEGLQQMYSTNQEQLQEIEYLSKQVDLLRSVNDQHAKVYEQLDLTARDLEEKNQKLVLENRVAQLKIEGLTETVEGLQTLVEELQREVKTFKSLPPEQPRTHLEGHDQDHTCCKEHQFCFHKRPRSTSNSSLQQEEEEEKHLLHSMQAQLSAERALRQAAEQEADALAQELSQLEPKLALLQGYKGRLAEMEAEVDELRVHVRSSSSTDAPCTHSLLPTTVFLSPDEKVGVVRQRGCHLKRCSSEKQLGSSVCEEGGATVNICESGRGYYKHAEGGISLLNEVDAQYTALQEKYDTLLRRCEGGTLMQNHKAVQTSAANQHKRSSAKIHTLSQGVDTQLDAHIPEYKALFHEIFSFIEKSKVNLKEMRIKPSQVE